MPADMDSVLVYFFAFECELWMSHWVDVPGNWACAQLVVLSLISARAGSCSDAS